MPFHLIAWESNVTNAVETDMAPVQDSIMSIQNSHFMPQRQMSILAAYVSSVSLSRARFVTPKFRQITTPFIRPQGSALLPISRPPVADYRSNPLMINGLEELQLLLLQGGAGAEVCYGLAALSETGVQPMAGGDVYTMRGTGTTTVTAKAWTQAAITWQDTLPAGNYQAVGLSGISTTGIAARLIFEQQTWRPGGILFAADGNIPDPVFTFGRLGNWGAFTGNRMPNVEVLCNAADTAQEVFLDFIRTG